MFEKMIIRLQTFISSKGGAVPVAEKIGKHPNKFYVMFRGETKPNSETILELKTAYPDLDLNWLYTGAYSDSDSLNKIEIPLSEVEKENKQLKESLEKIQEEIQEIKGEKKKLFDLLGKDESMTSQSLLLDRPIGFQIMEKIQSKGHEVGHTQRTIYA